NRGNFNSTHVYGTHVPVEEPSTASKADVSRCSKIRYTKPAYSITSSARASSVDGTVSPRALAVVKLTTRSNLVGCSTGRSEGFAPSKMLSTYSAARRYISVKLGP